jgi:Zn-dependent peptidase ImmA (M78 family)
VKRGFKAEAERIATDTRLELGLKCTDRLDPIDLAKHLEIPVVTMKELELHYGGRSNFRHYFSATDPDSFSAVTIFVSNYRRMIVHNENHHPHRQASNISHEISHTLLEHVPTAIVGSNGQRFWDSEMEQEANWLGAALLVPREGVKGPLTWHEVAPRRSKSQPTMESANHSVLGVWFKRGSIGN